MRERTVFIILTISLLALAVLRPLIGWRLAGLISLGDDSMRNSTTELAALRAELAALRDAKQELPSFSRTGKEGFVYVSYPFNFKHEFLINLGAEDGIAEGKAAVLPADENGILIGRTEKVFKNESLIQTIFDSNFQIGVRIGEKGIEALLKGGSVPKLTLIPKTASIRIGDPVFAAGQGVPYGLSIGTIKEVRLVNGGLLQEATISFPYKITELHALTILP